ncbi:MAG: BatA domain-containing protein [Planctomycetota bacterium]
MTDWLSRFFQHPAFLPVIAALLIPLIIEWLLRRRTRRIPFAAMRFLVDTDRPRKIRLQDRILMILRMVIIGLIVLALARPLIRPEDVISVDQDERSAVMLFDATYSNAQRVGNASAFAIARRMARDVLAGLPEGVEVTVGAMGHSLNVVQDWTDDKGLLREKIDGMTVSHGAGPISVGLDWALDEAKKKAADDGGPRSEIYVFSDLQVRTWEGTRDEGTAGTSARALVPKLAELGPVFVARTGGEEAFNLFVERFEPVDKVLAVGVTTEFRVQVATTNLAEGERVPARLTLYVNGERRHFQKVRVPAGGATFRVPYRVLKAGEQLVKVVVEGDDSPLDNERLYLAEVPEAMRVLILDRNADLPPHQRPSVFWEYAVAPPSPPGRDPVSAFTVRTLDWTEAQKENLGDYGAVVLANMPELPPGLVSRLLFYVKEGGCLLAFAGEGVSAYSYESLFREGRGPLPATFRDKVEVSAFLRSLLPNSGDLEAAAFRHARALAAADPEDVRTLARLSTGEPLVLARRYGQGHALILGMDPTLKWTRLPLAVDFPVFVQELLRAVLGDPNRLVNLNVGDEFSQPVLISTQHLLLKTPDGRKVRLTPGTVEDADLPRIAYADTDAQGLYRLEAPPGVLARERFVVNLTPSEGDMAMWDEGDFRREIAANVQFLSPHENVTKRIESRHALREFAGMILFLVFLLLLVETFLAMRFGLRKV